MLNSAPFNCKSYESSRLSIFEATLSVNSNDILSISDNARWDLIFFELYFLFSPTLFILILSFGSLMTAFYWIHCSSTFSRVASLLFFLRVLSLLVVYKLYDHTLFLSLMCGNEIWLGCFFIVRCMDMRLLIECHFSRALLVRSQVPKWMLYLLYFPSYSGWDPILSWLFSARKRRTYFIFYGIFLWKLYLRAACTQLRDFFLDYSVTYFQFSVSLQLALQLQYFSWRVHCFCFFFSNANLSSS